MKRQAKKEVLKSRLGSQEARGSDCVENSKRRHMLSCLSGDVRFFERILMTKHFQDPEYVVRSSARHR